MQFDVTTLSPLIEDILQAFKNDWAALSVQRIRQQLVGATPILTADFVEKHKQEIDKLILSLYGSKIPYREASNVQLLVYDCPATRVHRTVY